MRKCMEMIIGTMQTVCSWLSRVHTVTQVYRWDNSDGDHHLHDDVHGIADEGDGDDDDDDPVGLALDKKTQETILFHPFD